MDATRTPLSHDDAPLLTPRSRRTLVGLAVSFAAHLALLGLLAVFLLEAPGTGTRVYGPAVEMQTGTEVASDTSDADEWLDESLPDLADAVPMPEIEAESSAAQLSIVSAASAAPLALSGGSGTDDGESLSLGGAAAGGASFFGVEASGSRIVYIVDVSGSMLHNGKIQSLQRELLASVASLPPGSEFVVIVFSDAASTRALGGSATWRDAGASGRADVETAVRALTPSGGTEPLDAFRLAFELDPKPEAVYFMTDGQLPQRDAAMIIGAVKVMNQQSGPAAPIHCIAFGSRDGASDLRRIARQSGGTYTYVNSLRGAR